MSTIDKQEKLTFEGSHSSEMHPAMTHFLTFCLCLITEKGHSELEKSCLWMANSKGIMKLQN